ncbi:unnamed protein product [Ambrosiozyma monospora]|uniref:Unnamed protein product n=1 Tax=Ambrosiozyma monospora TaxID=43982 RepID=A0ACB5SRL6_AMBMO|nr:unnamed protein product [Ambrosiozyma monospora]
MSSGQHEKKSSMELLGSYNLSVHDVSSSLGLITKGLKSLKDIQICCSSSPLSNQLPNLKKSFSASNGDSNTSPIKDSLKAISNHGGVLGVVDLFDVNLIPPWLISGGFGGDDIGGLFIQTYNSDTMVFFKEIVGLSNFEDNTIIGLLIEPNLKSHHIENHKASSNFINELMVIYPSFNSVSKSIDLRLTILDFNNEINAKLTRIHNLWMNQKLQAGDPNNNFLIELRYEKKKQDLFFRNYLKKREAHSSISTSSTTSATVTGITSTSGTSFKNSTPLRGVPSLSRQNSQMDHVLSHNCSVETYNKLLENFILSEFRIRSVYSKLAKDEYKELYSIILKSAKFILRYPIKQSQVPNVEKINTIIMNLFDMFLEDEDVEIN